MKLAKLFPFLFIFVLLFCSSAFSYGDVEWRPVSEQEIKMSKGVVNPNADAEAIFWDVWINDRSSSKLSLSNYVRVKIFTDRGREKYAKIDVPFSKRWKIKNLAARVIKPDGTIVELPKSDVFE
ncbi:MAG: DUF3857 domain-containing protein [Pyrinomonadaceae bacterium]